MPAEGAASVVANPPLPRWVSRAEPRSGAARVEANPTVEQDLTGEFAPENKWILPKRTQLELTSSPPSLQRDSRSRRAAVRGLRNCPRITGQLPVADAALLSAQLDALMPAASTYGLAGEAPSRDARRADALVLLTQHAAGSGTVPSHGVDRPQVHITLNLDTLTSGLGDVCLLGASGVDGLSAGHARRLACDARLVPMVLGTGSRPLDVGRAHRLFTPALRAALIERDQGCVVPGCTTTPAAFEAHHIVPWWASGATCLANGVLLCPFHHRLVEPDPLQSEESQWRVHLDAATGLPWFTPPRHIDPARRPRQHQRHRLQQLAPRVAGRPCPPDPDLPDSVSPVVPERLAPDLDELIRRSSAVWASAG